MGLLEKRIMMIKPLRLKLKKPSITGLATTVALNAVETNIPNVSDLVKKTNYDVKISDFESKYFTTSDYSKFTGEILNAKIKEKELVDKYDISGLEIALL